jgi:hypothetical protein
MLSHSNSQVPHPDAPQTGAFLRLCRAERSAYTARATAFRAWARRSSRPLVHGPRGPALDGSDFTTAVLTATIFRRPGRAAGKDHDGAESPARPRAGAKSEGHFWPSPRRQRRRPSRAAGKDHDGAEPRRGPGRPRRGSFSPRGAPQSGKLSLPLKRREAGRAMTRGFGG